MKDLQGILVVLALLGALVGVTKLLRQRGVLASESSRKMVHMGMGVVCLCFPYLFQDVTPVWILAALACLALSALRVVPVLQRQLGSVLNDVDRFSLGEMYFPIGVAAVFTLSAHRTVLFQIPVAILTFADAAGALIGKRFGRVRYATVEGTKTVEGSLAVGFVAACCAFVPLASAVDLPMRLTISAQVGLFCLLVEAISWRGLDNLFMPLAAFAQLSIYLHQPEVALLERLGVLTLLTIATFVWRKGTLIDGSARLGSALALYFFWAICGWRWTIAPLVFLASYVRLMPAVPGGVAKHNLFAVLCVASAAVFWCTVQALGPREDLLWPFTLSIAAHQAIISIVRYSQARPRWGRVRWWAAGTGLAALVHLSIFWLLDRGATLAPDGYAAGLALLALATAIFAAWERDLPQPRDLNTRLWKQGLVGFGASIAGLLCYSL